MKIDVGCIKKELAPACLNKAVSITFWQCYGASWADSTRLGVGRLVTWRLPLDEAEKIEVGKFYIIEVSLQEYKNEQI